MTNNAKHTPTPYATDNVVIVNDWEPAHVKITNGRKIIAKASYGKTDAERRANAAFIVKACNNHDALLIALKRVVCGFDGLNDMPFAIDNARHVLKGAK
jgi:hypothetical protein